MTITEMRELKKQNGYTLEKIVDRSGLDFEIVAKIFSEDDTIGQKEFCKMLSYSEIRSLERVFVQADVNKIAEALGVYKVKKQGEYTLEDYYALSDEQRYELIDGILYDMAAPTVVHQELVLEIAAALRQYIKGKGGKCKVFDHR